MCIDCAYSRLVKKYCQKPLLRLRLLHSSTYMYPLSRLSLINNLKVIWVLNNWGLESDLGKCRVVEVSFKFKRS